MKKTLLSVLALVAIIGCSSATAKESKVSATYLESVDQYNTITAMKLVDKETGCKYLVINTGKNAGRNVPSVTQMLDADGKPLCNK